ncbi:uncharacterized protein LOC115628038 [Scaptodrosophila lebanonensis]|uniref:Uncharacterized protein LOC115628038 n=1 Tax=Drosophila lebanonensis TaxID=7225 RepID=A0A6J2TUT1_DROLE|nr:uncharacterized protein LOC115628038 [Scaptodrosophila lebanonensis]
MDWGEDTFADDEADEMDYDESIRNKKKYKFHKAPPPHSSYIGYPGYSLPNANICSIEPTKVVRTSAEIKYMGSLRPAKRNISGTGIGDNGPISPSKRIKLSAGHKENAQPMDMDSFMKPFPERIA